MESNNLIQANVFDLNLVYYLLSTYINMDIIYFES